MWSLDRGQRKGDQVGIAFVAWQRYHRRSDLLAQRLGSAMHFISYGQQGKPLQTPVRYVVQAWRTWRVLRRERPQVVFVQNPPIFCVLVASLYARLYGAEYVIDSHTGAFLSPAWRWSIGLHRMLSRRALTTIVHNTDQEEVVKRWGCDCLLLADPLGDYPSGEPFRFRADFNVAVVGSFGSDEPVGAVFEAARQLTDVCFYFTGNAGRLDSRLLAKKAENCILTGYLPDERYVALLRGADCVMVLTTRDHTLLCGAFEAVSLGTPLITSAWPVLRKRFALGTVHVSNTMESICEGVRLAQQEKESLRREVLLLRDQLQLEWEEQFVQLRNALSPMPATLPLPGAVDGRAAERIVAVLREEAKL